MNARKKRLLIVLACIVIGVVGVHVYMRGENKGGADPSGQGVVATAARRVPVVLASSARRSFTERLAVQGTLEAKHSALVTARIPGTVVDIYVDEGDAVVADETALFQTDRLKLEKVLEISQHDYAVAQCALREKQAYLERIEADLEKAEIDYKRFQDLRAKSAVSADALEQQESRFKQAKAMHKHGQSLLDLAAEQQRQAKAAVEIAQKDLSDTLVAAPISGVISRRFMEPGEIGDPGKPVVQIEDNSEIEVSAFLPSQHYDRVQVGETSARIRVCGAELEERPIGYKSPTINPMLRTFEIKCTLRPPPPGAPTNPGGVEAVPGALAEIEVLLEQRTGLGIPAKAVQRRGGRKVVFIVENDIARMVAVETGLETEGWIELRGAPFAEGTAVATMGQFLLKDGTPVTVQRHEAEGETP